MKIGLVTDSLADLPFGQMLATAAELGIAGIELNTSNWSNGIHCDLAGLLVSEQKRRALLDAVHSRGLELYSLNANGNQLHPTDGARQSKNLYDTVTLAAQLGVQTVVCMSGLPAGAPGDVTPNWIVCSWPPEVLDTLRWQWEEQLIPYWVRLAEHVEQSGVERIAIEIHGHQLVYNPRSLMRLRNEIGPIVGANFDPSHRMWMGGDPLRSVDYLGDAIHHVHAKDTYLNPDVLAVAGRLENGPLDTVADRSWWHVTLGYGHPSRGGVSSATGSGWWVTTDGSRSNTKTP